MRMRVTVLSLSVCLFVCLSVCLLPVSCFLFTFIRQIIPTCLFFARFSRFPTIRIRWNGFFREIERFSRLFCSFQSRWTAPYTTCGYNGHVDCHARSTISANSANSIGAAALLVSGQATSRLTAEYCWHCYRSSCTFKETMSEFIAAVAIM